MMIKRSLGNSEFFTDLIDRQVIITFFLDNLKSLLKHRFFV